MLLSPGSPMLPLLLHLIKFYVSSPRTQKTEARGRKKGAKRISRLCMPYECVGSAK